MEILKYKYHEIDPVVQPLLTKNKRHVCVFDIGAKLRFFIGSRKQ